jgi:hypothetical protein
MKLSTNAKIGITVGVIAAVVIVLGFSMTAIPAAVSFNKPGVSVLPLKYGGHVVVKTENASLITENKQPVFNSTLLDFNALPNQIKVTFTVGDHKESAIFEFNKVQYDESRISKELGGLPLTDGGSSVIFVQWNPNGPQAGWQFLFKNAADGNWYMNRWPQYVGTVDDYLNVLGGLAA